MRKYMHAKKIVLDVIKKKWGDVAIIITALFVTAVLSLLSPIIYKIIIDDVIPNKNQNDLILYLLILILLPWIITFIASVKNYFSTKLGESITSTLRKITFAKVLHAKQEAFERITPPQIQNRITRECGRIGEIYITKDIVTFISEIITLFATLVTMMMFNISLTCICIVAFPASFVITKVVSRKSKALDSEYFRCLEKGERFLSEVLNKIKTIKLKNRYHCEELQWYNWLIEHKNNRLKTTITHSLNGFLLGDFIINIIYGAMFFISGLLVIEGAMTIGTLVSFIAFIPKVYTSLKNVLNIKITTNVISNAFESIEEILNLPQEQQEGAGVKEISSIVFQDVCFKYNRNDFEIEKMNFEVKKGRFLGVVGKSGGGKTTIFDLITGLYYPNAGSVKINEFTTEQLNINKLRTKISVVTQDIVLFNGSIRENICFNNDIKENAYTNILNVVSLNDFIGQLPQGDQTDIGYNGELLSGGERQRISIANALLAESDVILLDEFTSALDLETEKRIVNHIFNLKDKIVIIISHRIYTLMNCDEVIVISKGNIIEKGNPKELCEQSDSFFAGMLGDMNYEAK